MEQVGVNKGALMGHYSHLAVCSGKTNSSVRLREKFPDKWRNTVVQMSGIKHEHSDQIISSKTDFP